MKISEGMARSFRVACHIESNRSELLDALEGVLRPANVQVLEGTV